MTYADPSGHISIKSAWNAVKTGAKAVASAVTAAVKSGAAAVSNAVKSVISKPTVTLGNTSRSSGGTVSAYAKVSGVVRNQAAQKKAAKSAAWADFVGQPLTVCEAAAAWADWGAEKAAGYMDQSLWGPGLMVGAYEVEAVKCFAYSQLENSIHLIIPEADVERMLRGAGLMLGGSFKCFGGFMLAAGSSTLSWTGLGVLGMAAGGFVVGAGASDINQGGEEFFLGMSGDSTTQTRNGMSDLFYDGNDTIYHLSTGVAAFAGSLLTPYVAYAAKTTTAGSTVGNPAPTVTEAAGGTVDDALEQLYDDIFESSYGEQFDPVKEQAIVGTSGIEDGSATLAQYGDDFGKMGTYVEDPNIKVDWTQYAEHAAERMQQRGMTQEMVNNIVENGKVLSQNNGNKFAYITQEGVVIISKEGKLITTWTSKDFDSNMSEIINKLFGEQVK